MNCKQVIVFRKDLLKGDHAIRKGKIAAQCCHASLGALLKSFEVEIDTKKSGTTYTYKTTFKEGSVLDSWLRGTFTKIVVYAENEEELRQLKAKCDEKHIPNALIVDAGNTEFHGVPTVTCLGIGPEDSKAIDEITGNLPLL